MMEAKSDGTDTKALKKYRNIYPSKHGCIIHLNPEVVQDVSSGQKCCQVLLSAKSEIITVQSSR